MKLDKIKFAQVVGFIERTQSLNFSIGEIEQLDDMIDIDVPIQDNPRVSEEDVKELLLQMSEGDKFHAIKVYRALTGVGLKEAKDVVDKYCNASNLFDAYTLKCRMLEALKSDSCIIGDENKSLVREFIKSFSHHKY